LSTLAGHFFYLFSAWVDPSVDQVSYLCFLMKVSLSAWFDLPFFLGSFFCFFLLFFIAIKLKVLIRNTYKFVSVINNDKHNVKLLLNLLSQGNYSSMLP
jgi:hypothetical protein